MFASDYKATIGVDFSAKTVTVKDTDGSETLVALQFWDIAGQEYYSQLSRSYFKNAYGCIQIVDLNSETLVKDVEQWKKEINSKVFAPNTKEVIPTVLCFNKCDLPGTQEIFLSQTASPEITELKFTGWQKTSALTGEGLDSTI